MKKKWSVLLSSDRNYESLVAEIYFGDQFVALVTENDGETGGLMIEFPPSLDRTNDGQVVGSSLQEFLEIIEVARSRLLSHHADR